MRCIGVLMGRIATAIHFYIVATNSAIIIEPLPAVGSCVIPFGVPVINEAIIPADVGVKSCFFCLRSESSSSYKL